MAEQNVARGVDPLTVTSPQRFLVKESLNILHDGGAWREGDPWSGFSVAQFTWDGNPNAIGCRWNGEEGVNPGNPSARGYPTWFIIPDPLAGPLVEAVRNRKSLNDSGGAEAPHDRLRRSVKDFLAAAQHAKPADLAILQAAI